MSRRLLDVVPGYRELYNEEVSLRTQSFYDIEGPLTTEVRSISKWSIVWVGLLFLVNLLALPLSLFLKKWYNKISDYRKQVYGRIVHYKPVSIGIVPLTPDIYTSLELVKCPFITGTEYTPSDVLFFLWTISEQKQHDPSNKSMKRFIKRYTGIVYKDACEYIALYLDNSFMDMHVKGGQSDTSDRLPVASTLATYIHMLAKSYGWHEKDIMEMSYRRIFQYCRLITQDNNPKIEFKDRSTSSIGELMRRSKERQ